MVNKLLILAVVALLSGCHHYGIFVKREAELNCPTDIRKKVPWCAGEDAIFMCPCGPSEQFHGYKPTCWRVWQTSAVEWRDLHCGPVWQSGCLSNSELIPPGSIPDSEGTMVPALTDPLKESLEPPPAAPEQQAEPESAESPSASVINSILTVDVEPPKTSRGKSTQKHFPQQPLALRARSKSSLPIPKVSRRPSSDFTVIQSTYEESGSPVLVRLPPVE